MRRFHPDFDLKRRELSDREYVEWCLAGSYTKEGIQRWWNRPRNLLDGKTPEEVWDTHREKVISLVEWSVS